MALIGRSVFSADDLFGETDDLWEDDEDLPSHQADHANQHVREARPGDLGLPEAIERLNLDVEKLETQQDLLNGMLSKAELTNNFAELKILRKSVSNIDKDIRYQELQRQQWIVQASDNSLFKRTHVSIGSVHVSKEFDGHEYASYEIKLERQATDNIPAASWVISKRYSEFHDLHRRLCALDPRVRKLPFPKRQVVGTLQDDFVQRRRATLEQYLRHLLRDISICQSLELRAFLSEQPIRAPRFQQLSMETTRRDTTSRLYAALSEGLEDFVGNASFLDQLSLAGQNLISAAVTTMPTTSRSRIPEHSTPAAQIAQPSPATSTDPAMAAEAQAEIAAFNRTALPEAMSTSSANAAQSLSSKDRSSVAFIEPIAKCFSTVFQTKSGNNWLRGRAVVIVLQQLLGGTVERRVKEVFADLTTSSRMAFYLDTLRLTLWPDGEARRAPQERSAASKARTRRNAEEILCAIFIENTGSIIGRRAAKEAAKRTIRCMSHERLNCHLLYTLLDEMIPELLETVGSTPIGAT